MNDVASLTIEQVQAGLAARKFSALELAHSALQFAQAENPKTSAYLPKITIRLNSQTILEADQSELADVNSKPAAAPAPKDKPRKGFVALQSHSGRVEFRKVQIREQ
jgi:Asp-tRNA(Asn)/Glu-tRNA(Gln) amidotransferase A subunit family amidase